MWVGQTVSDASTTHVQQYKIHTQINNVLGYEYTYSGNERTCLLPATCNATYQKRTVCSGFGYGDKRSKCGLDGLGGSFGRSVISDHSMLVIKSLHYDAVLCFGHHRRRRWWQQREYCTSIYLSIHAFVWCDARRTLCIVLAPVGGGVAFSRRGSDYLWCAPHVLYSTGWWG